jgi:hypothetical protein
VLTPTARRRAGAALALAAFTALAACGSDPEPRPAPAAASSPSPSPSAEPAPPPPPAPEPVNPFTGVAPKPTSPVVAVKIDNARLARPFHRGLELAPIVYQELVEGGATRFLVVYDTAPDVEVGPVRSVRESDLELVQQFGTVALSYSGGNGGTLQTVDRYVAAGQVLNASYDVMPELYRRASKRSDAYNFYVSPGQLAARMATATPAKDIGLTFGPIEPTAGVPVSSATVAFSKLASAGVRWQPETGRWQVLQDGTPLPAVAPANVIVQQVGVRATSYKDVGGYPTPYTETVGAGRMTMLRDGRRIDGQWSRPDPAAGTRFTDDAGADLPLAPGPTWILLVPAGAQLRVG